MNISSFISIIEEDMINVINSNKSNEPLLQEEQRLCVSPILYPDIWDLYKKQMRSFWTREELDLSKDYLDYKKLDKDTQYFIKYVSMRADRPCRE